MGTLVLADRQISTARGERDARHAVDNQAGEWVDAARHSIKYKRVKITEEMKKLKISHASEENSLHPKPQ